MTRIDGSLQIAEALRRRLEALKRDRAGATNHQGATSPAATQSGRQDATGGLLARIQHIPADDPQRERKAFRAFLETTLLIELGDSLINDPGFYDMVANIQLQMEADAELRQAMHEAARILLGAVPGSE